jgi:tetratricopeptide (TPR) repeat protein
LPSPDPSDPFLLGVAAAHDKELDRALALFDRALAAAPTHALAHFNRACVLQDLGRREEALAAYDRALELRADYAEAHANRGTLLEALGRPLDALAAYDAALALKLDFAAAHANRGNALRSLGRHDAALESYARALEWQPDNAVALVNSGNVLRQLGRFDAALSRFERALEFRPGMAEAHANRAAVLKALGRDDAALEAYERAVALNPGLAAAWANRGMLLRDLGRLEEALASQERALALAPGHGEALINRGVVLTELHRLDSAVESFDQALRVRPDAADARFNRAIALLLAGRYEQGWLDYESRWRCASSRATPRDFSQPLWTGREALSGKSILIHAEQGFGDTLQFCRYIRLVAEQGAAVTFEVQGRLLRLLSSLHSGVRVIARGSPLPSTDYHCPLLSLPLAFGTTLADIPCAPRYVAPDQELLAQWRRLLGAAPRTRIGLAWSGSGGNPRDAHRNVPLGSLLAALPPGVDTESLQKEYRDADRDTLQRHPALRDWSAAQSDFADAAALCDSMDLILTVDTSIVHLAGALGKPTWLLLPFHPDWRWLLGRTDSPWYPSLRVFRQTSPGDWAPVLSAVRSALGAVL